MMVRLYGSKVGINERTQNSTEEELGSDPILSLTEKKPVGIM